MYDWPITTRNEAKKQDRTLERCFGVKKAVSECDWAYLQTLETVQEPRCRIPRLADLLEYLARPGLEHVWVLLDIKVRLQSLLLPSTTTTNQRLTGSGTIPPP